MKKTDRVRSKVRSWNLHKKVIEFLGGRCRCGETDLRVLDIGHKNGGGTKERKKIPVGTFYRNILSGKRKTDDIEVQCVRCNRIEDYEKGRRYSPPAV